MKYSVGDTFPNVTFNWLDEKYNFKRGLENAIYDVYGYSKYPGAWKLNSHRLAMNAKYCKSNWQYHFVSNFIHHELYGHYDEFITEKTFNNVYKEDCL